MHEARVARQAANPVHSEVKLGEGSSSIRVKLIEVHGQALGSSLWESGALLGHVLVSLAGKELVSGRRRAIELGCGVGLSGLALAMLPGRREVVLTDNNAEALAVAQKNICANNLSATVSAAELCWTEPHEAVQRLGDFDLVIAADVLYRYELLTPFLTTILALTRPGALVFLGYKQRIASDSAFFDAARRSARPRCSPGVRAAWCELMANWLCRSFEIEEVPLAMRATHAAAPLAQAGDPQGGEWVTGARPCVLRMVRRSDAPCSS